MLASEQILIDISPHNRAWNISTAFYLWSATVQAEGTQNISTAESPGRWLLFSMTLRKFLTFIVGLVLILAVAIGLTSIYHPIILKWVSGSARLIGKSLHATVYTNGQVNRDIKVFHADKYWASKEKANNYILSLPEFESLGKLKFFNVNLNEKWVGCPVGTSKRDYDLIWGSLFQSESGAHFTPFQDDIKGFQFDPQLSFSKNRITFNVPPNTLKFDSVRIELE